MIPSRFPRRRLKFLLSAPMQYGANEAAESTDPSLPRFIRITDIDSSGRLRDDTVRTISEDAAAGYILRDGDVLFARSGATVGKSFIYDPSWGRAAFAGYLVRAAVNPELGSARFLYYFAQSKWYWDQIDAGAIQTTIQNVSAEKYKNVLVPVPDVARQRAIAEFLDRETARIDELIAKNKRLIGLCEERKSAAIFQLVTKGLHADCTLRDSGVTWIGSIPQHWEAIRLKRVARLFTGHTPSRLHPEYWVDCTIPWISLGDVWQLRDGRQEFITDTLEKISELGLANSAARLLPTGTVIVSRTASVGFSGIMASPMATTQDFVNWVCGPRLSAEYLLWVFRAMSPELHRLSSGSVHQTIYMPDVWGFTIPLPPIQEQSRIVAEIRILAASLDRLVSTTARAIDKLQEYRIALISAAVTGQIDVRTYRKEPEAVLEETG